MNRRYFLLGGLAAPVVAKKERAPERPNIVLMLAEELGAWALGCYGAKEIRTPNIDRLSQTGMRFTDNYAVAPVASTSRAPLASLAATLGVQGYNCGSASDSAALDFVASQAPGKPFFLAASFKPQADGVAQKYHDMYAAVKFNATGWEPAAANAARNKEMLKDIPVSLRQAAARITALDDRVGALLDAVTRRGVADNTLIVFTSMSGSLLGRHGLWGDGTASEPVNMYEEVVRVPAIWSWPVHIPPQGVRPELVSSNDIVPTICDFAAAPAPAGPCARSYRLLLEGRRLPKKQPWRTTVFSKFQNTAMARDGRYKLVQRDSGRGPGELYDLAGDSREKVNQIANPRFLSALDELRGELAAWLKQCG